MCYHLKGWRIYCMIGSQAFSDACWEMLKSEIPEYLTKLVRVKLHSWEHPFWQDYERENSQGRKQLGGVEERKKRREWCFFLGGQQLRVIVRPAH